MSSTKRLPSENLIVWDCPTCGATGADHLFGDEETGVCETCGGSGEAEVTKCCKQLPGACTCSAVSWIVARASDDGECAMDVTATSEDR